VKYFASFAFPRQLHTSQMLN